MSKRENWKDLMSERVSESQESAEKDMLFTSDFDSGDRVTLKLESEGREAQDEYDSLEWEITVTDPADLSEYFAEGSEATLRVSSTRFLEALLNCDPEVGDEIDIIRTGSGYDTDYRMEVLE